MFRSGGLVAVRGSQYAPPADLDKLPKYVPAAFVAIEDRWYYYHFGFNPWGILRSQIYNSTHHGGPLRGGSTSRTLIPPVSAAFRDEVVQ